MPAKARTPAAQKAPHAEPRTPAHQLSCVDDVSSLNERAQWQLTFGFRDAVDLLYAKYPSVVKPRLPTDMDRFQPWRNVVLPQSVGDLLGNPQATAVLRDIRERQRSGAEGSGKYAFLRLLRQAIETATLAERPSKFQMFDAKRLSERELVTSIEDAVKKVDSDKTTLFVVVENVQAVPIAAQQHHLLPLITVCNTKNVFAIVVIRPDATKLPDQLRQHAGLIHMKSLGSMHTREKVLQTCTTLKIGYHRDGIEELLLINNFELLACLRTLQTVFVAYHFISIANLQKNGSTKDASVATPAMTSARPPPFPLSIVAMNEPLRRCKLCTLLPPCSHVTLHHLHDRVDRIRQFYPSRESETPPAPMCPSYFQRGICGNIQSIGRCRYAHPQGVHTIDRTALIKRCASHTLPLPCIHCDCIHQARHELREEEAALARLSKDLVVNKKLLLDTETERYIFVREQTKTVKWGAARRDYESKLATLDVELQRARQCVDDQQLESQRRREKAQRLAEDIRRGRSKGVGKGKGRVAPAIQSA